MKKRDLDKATPDPGVEEKLMRFEGRIWKDNKSKNWLIEVPLLDVMTQGASKEDAYRMIADAVETLVDQKKFNANVRPSGTTEFTLGANQEGPLIALMLRRQREAHHLTLMEMAQRLNSKSPNAFARYEQGKSIPTIEKLNELMKAIDPAFEPILKVA